MFSWICWSNFSWYALVLTKVKMHRHLFLHWPPLALMMPQWSHNEALCRSHTALKSGWISRPHTPCTGSEHHFIYLGSYRREAGRLVWYALRMLFTILPSKITFILCLYSTGCTRGNNGANTAAHNAFWSVNTCCAVPLHNPSRNEPSQNQCYEMRMPCSDADSSDYHERRTSLRMRALQCIFVRRKLKKGAWEKEIKKQRNKGRKRRKWWEEKTKKGGTGWNDKKRERTHKTVFKYIPILFVREMNRHRFWVLCWLHAPQCVFFSNHV
jgi:hypothetical protein